MAASHRVLASDASQACAAAVGVAAAFPPVLVPVLFDSAVLFGALAAQAAALQALAATAAWPPAVASVLCRCGTTCFATARHPATAWISDGVACSVGPSPATAHGGIQSTVSPCSPDDRRDAGAREREADEVPEAEQRSGRGPEAPAVCDRQWQVALGRRSCRVRPPACPVARTPGGGRFAELAADDAVAEYALAPTAPAEASGTTDTRSATTRWEPSHGRSLPTLLHDVDSEEGNRASRQHGRGGCARPDAASCPARGMAVTRSATTRWEPSHGRSLQTPVHNVDSKEGNRASRRSGRGGCARPDAASCPARGGSAFFCSAGRGKGLATPLTEEGGNDSSSVHHCVTAYASVNDHVGFSSAHAAVCFARDGEMCNVADVVPSPNLAVFLAGGSTLLVDAGRHACRRGSHFDPAGLGPVDDPERVCAQYAVLCGRVFLCDAACAVVPFGSVDVDVDLHCPALRVRAIATTAILFCLFEVTTVRDEPSVRHAESRARLMQQRRPEHCHGAAAGSPRRVGGDPSAIGHGSGSRDSDAASESRVESENGDEDSEVLEPVGCGVGLPQLDALEQASIAFERFAALLCAASAASCQSRPSAALAP